MIFIIIQGTLNVAGRLAANENHTLWFLIFVKSTDGSVNVAVYVVDSFKVLTLTTTCECTISLYYRIFTRGMGSCSRG